MKVNEEEVGDDPFLEQHLRLCSWTKAPTGLPT